MSDRPTPAKVRSVLARIRKVQHWLNSSEYVPDEGNTTVHGAIGDSEGDTNFREGVMVALSWVAGEYGKDDMPAGIHTLAQHTNRREFERLLKSYEEEGNWHEYP